MKNKNAQTKNTQTGATLIVSLVILTVVTALGLASMRNSNLELKMSASSRDRSVAFQNAESALRAIETDLENSPYSKAELECRTGVDCFNNTCSGGLCFNGVYSASVAVADCATTNPNGADPQMWKSKAYWGDNAKSKNVPNSKKTSVNNSVDYLIEFLCFSPDPAIKAPPPEGSTKMLPLYRITVLAEGEARRSSVMLQSVYRGATLQLVADGDEEGGQSEG